MNRSFYLLLLAAFALTGCGDDNPVVPEPPPPPIPQWGYWSGLNDYGGEVRFTVSADGSQVCGFYMYWPGYPGACGLIAQELFGTIPIDSCKFKHATLFLILPSDFGGTLYEGTFTSSNSIDGTWLVSRSPCKATGTWDAKPLDGGPFGSKKDGSIEIYLWLNNPTPTRGDYVYAFGQILDKGVGRDDLIMRFDWSDNEGHTGFSNEQSGSDGPGLANCKIGQIGSPLGDSLAINLTVGYSGRKYSTTVNLVIDNLGKNMLLSVDLRQTYPNSLNPENEIRYYSGVK